ncbi:MAG: hypothetical protein LBO09_02635 [Candidatus Peribacteria bacterium]|jgi:hypothetical protein|nr:hypothetical protein [Candidatus Peribacteria bacterium]
MFGGKSLQSFILGGKDLKSATIDDIPHFEPPMLHVVAATLIANIEKGGGMYRGLAKFSNSGLWIKALLGPEHHKQFLRAKADLIAEIRSGKSNSDQLQDQLAKCEIEYITNNINGAAGGQRF